jgi:hypothetical protein
MTINFTHNNGNGKLYAGFVLTKNNRKKEIGLNGQNAKALLSLIKSKHGISTYEGYASGLPRLSWYVCVLRHEYDINIITMREEHVGGWHGRYVLLDKVEVAKVWG